jgi:membrane fusion protein (multidrug efflux system)
VARLIQADRIKMAFGAAERDVPLLKVGQEASFTLDSLPGRSFTGRVTFIALSSDPQTGTYPVEIVAANPAGALRPGMVAQVTLTRRTVPQTVSAPTFAVVPKEDGDVVFVLAGTKAVRRKVETGIRENGWIQVLSGLAAGEPLIVKGQRDLQDGQEVRVIR